MREEGLTPCDGSLLRLTCWQVLMPETRARPGGPFVELAIVRVSHSTAPAGHAHILPASGPGDSGVRVALDLATQDDAMLAEVMDGGLIGIDQRGTGDSVPCPRTTVRYELPLDQLASEANWLQLAERAPSAVAAQMRERGIELQAYNTEESADDVDAVRQTLGEDRRGLWGHSYGSHPALAMARRHPRGVERVVLVGPEGPDNTWKLPFVTGAVLQCIAERAGAREMPAQLPKATARLAQAPAHLDVSDLARGRNVCVVLDALDLQWLVAQIIRDPRALATLPAAAREMRAGNFRRIGSLAMRLRRHAGVRSATKHMTDLTSDASAARQARFAREEANAALGDAMYFPDRHLHAARQAQPLGEAFRQPVTVPVPTLLLLGDLDARAPMENAREITAALPRAHLVVAKNEAHRFDLFGPSELRLLLRRIVRGDSDLLARDMDLEALPASGDDTLELESELAALRDGLARLPTLECEVLTLFYLQELSLDEVAQVLAVPVGTVKSRLHRARRLLRHQLGIQGGRG